MFTKFNFFLVLILGVASATIAVQGSEFGGVANYGFEDVQIFFADEFQHTIDANRALPSWAPYSTYTSPNGDTPLPVLFYDTFALDSPWISVHDNASPNFQPIEGQYSVLIQGGNLPGGSAWIVQPVTVPVGSKSLVFGGKDVQGLEVSFGGQTLPYFEIGADADYKIYAADARGLIGQAGDLKLLASFGNWGLVDSVHFSTIYSVPEFSTPLLFTFGAVLVSVVKKAGKRR
jgi:hypothetical protein